MIATSHRLLWVAAFCMLAQIVLTPGAPAQQTGAPLPPALLAAIRSGDPQSVSQAIATLAAGNPARSAQLADQAIAVAEKMLATNPKAAIAIAGAAVTIVSDARVDTAAPTDVQATLTIAARIFVSPDAQKVAPDAVAQLATATVQAAGSLAAANPAFAAQIATQGVATAEKLLALAPAAAVQLAGAAVQVAQSQTVQSQSPADALQVAATAARILISPEAQQAAPQAVAAMAVAVVQVATSPAVYQTAPNTAIAAMANAYNAVTSQTVQAAAPQAVVTVTQVLTQAENASALNQANATNAAQVNAILAQQTDETTIDQTNNAVPAPPADDDRVITASPT
jgi:hypothetical protein